MILIDLVLLRGLYTFFSGFFFAELMRVSVLVLRKSSLLLLLVLALSVAVVVFVSAPITFELDDFVGFRYLLVAV